MWSESDYFELWARYLDRFANEISAQNGFSASVIQDDEFTCSEWAVSGRGRRCPPLKLQLIVKVDASTNSQNEEVEYILTSGCIFCAYKSILAEIRSPDRAADYLLSFSERFDLKLSNPLISFSGGSPHLLFCTYFPEEGHDVTCSLEKHSRAESIAELLGSITQIWADVRDLNKKFNCDGGDLLTTLRDEWPDKVPIPRDIFSELNFGIQRSGNEPLKALGEIITSAKKRRVRELRNLRPTKNLDF
jgi:hypothetical protein